jgi:hypothetical protein
MIVLVLLSSCKPAADSSQSVENSRHLQGTFPIKFRPRFLMNKTERGQLTKCNMFLLSNVVDTDPDPAFQFNPDTDMDLDPGVDDQKLEKIQ